ncbi:Uncharacterised protein [Mycobacteroides abscessus subsp. abscessus]|nr:Uncharacterised protein [Mycobacteroides abscessus subsp. abscessus]
MSVAPDVACASASVTRDNPSASANRGVRSLNCTPGSGKSATSRVSDATSSAISSGPVTWAAPNDPCSSRHPTG